MAGAAPAPQGPGPRKGHAQGLPPSGITAAGTGAGTGRARARLDALGTALDAASVALPEQERTALRQVRDEARAVCGRARGRLAAFRKTCWLVVLIQLCLLAAMLASFHFFLPEL